MNVEHCGRLVLGVDSGLLAVQTEFSGTLASEESKACFVLPLREAVARFARRNTRSTETEVDG